MFDSLKSNLLKKGYKVSCFENKESATEYLNRAIDGATVGFGGSVTAKEMGLYEALSKHNDVVWHRIPKEGKTATQIRDEARGTEVYISSVNGIAETGEIVNIDGTCNRVSEIFYGHKRVFLIVGINKLAKDYESALFRARNIAAPLNAKRLGVKTPCAVKGDRCYNCQSSERICRGLSVLWEKPSASTEYEIILVNEKLGY